MARPAKPYKEQGWYITRAGGVYRRLCPVAEGIAKARSLLREYLAQREQESKEAGGHVLPRLTVSELFVHFLQAVEAEKSKATFLDYQRWCVEFAKQHGKKLARDITKFDAQQFKQHLLTTTYALNKQPRNLTVTGTNARLLAYVKQSRRTRDDFARAVNNLALDVIEVQTWEYVTAYDVAGAAEALAEFVARPCVRDWHYVIDTPIPRYGTGSGETPKRPVHASVEFRCRNDVSVTATKVSTPTLRRHAALGL